MFLTLDQFLSFFPIVEMSQEEFVNRFIVTYAHYPTLKDLFDLKSVIKTPQDPRYVNRDRIIAYFYDVIIIHRHHYLTEFYNNYLKVPDPFQLKWESPQLLTPHGIDPTTIIGDPQFISAWEQYINNPNNDQDIKTQFNRLLSQSQPLHGLSLQKNDQSRRIIRNLNYIDILHRTRITNTCKSKTSFWQTLLNVYNQLQLEDRFFAPSSISLFLAQKSTGDINFNNFFYLFQQYQPKASILNPYTINWLLKHLFNGSKLLTPVLSWCTYLCAFMHSDWQEYVGVDVMPEVCQRCQFLFDYYRNTWQAQLTRQADIERLMTKRLTVICRPSESLLYDQQFITQYQDYFDAILMCPPYFDMEIYPTGQQSITTYPNYQQWLTSYWEDTVAMCHLVLKRGHKFAFIVNNYVSLQKQEYPLIQDLNLIALKYFKLFDVYQLFNRVSPLRMNKKNRTEMLFIYEKI